MKIKTPNSPSNTPLTPSNPFSHTLAGEKTGNVRVRGDERAHRRHDSDDSLLHDNDNDNDIFDFADDGEGGGDLQEQEQEQEQEDDQGVDEGNVCILLLCSCTMHLCDIHPQASQYIPLTFSLTPIFTSHPLNQYLGS